MKRAVWALAGVALVCTLVFGVLGGTPTSGEFTDRLVRFHRAYDKFERDYFQCPPPDRYTNCPMNPKAPDAKLYGDARKAAMALFDLKDK